MPKKHFEAIEEYVIAALRKRLREHLPHIERSLVETEGGAKAKIALSVTFSPDENTGDLELLIDCKSTIPGTKEIAKLRLDNAQLQLL